MNFICYRINAGHEQKDCLSHNLALINLSNFQTSTVFGGIAVITQRKYTALLYHNRKVYTLIHIGRSIRVRFIQGCTVYIYNSLLKINIDPLSLCGNYTLNNRLTIFIRILSSYNNIACLRLFVKYIIYEQ